MTRQLLCLKNDDRASLICKSRSAHGDSSGRPAQLGLQISQCLLQACSASINGLTLAMYHPVARFRSIRKTVLAAFQLRHNGLCIFQTLWLGQACRIGKPNQTRRFVLECVIRLISENRTDTGRTCIPWCFTSKRRIEAVQCEH